MDSTRTLDESLEEKSIQLELTNPTAEIPFKRVAGDKSPEASVITVGQRSLPIVERPLRTASEVECVAICKPESLDQLEQTGFAVFPYEWKMAPAADTRF
jgi:hypothetical protein